ncbi:cellulose 1,4-beta-cellobiosidase [Isoptericola jiangsuensis]|uniref:Glucanase n=1 Tax=Isoptericola jiangsuensis TaxID=548579 RepID=A0A2A9EWK1_9MICO|nr:glycoside hydrolase family 6 protein [Isoptericola jiangsuensis]PFG42660.1 cellulose 1,4-beta-cellobiosidase [Isoptericola jiangsuensis]
MRSRSRRPRDRAAVRPLAVAATLALAAAPVCVAASSASAAERVDNPFVGADQYVNSYWTANVAEAAAEAGGDLGAKMLTLTDTPTSVWMDRTSAIEGNADGPGLRYHLDAALEQQQGDTPMVFNLVIYNLPGRDCYALASNGLLPATAAGLAEYESEYIDPIADMLAEQQYENLRVVATIEPDSLPNLVTNMHEPKCQQSDPYYRAGVAYALDRLYEAGNVYSYIDAAHSGWLGWDSNAGPAVNVFKDVVTSTEHGYATVAGFVTNTANSTPLHEPFLEDTTFGSGGGTQVRQAEFYEWNRDFDELDWTEHLYSLATAAGFPSSIGMLVDTSRNGWGGPDRPTAASTSTDLNTYVNASRVDRRTHRGAWCNPDGAGLGERPTVAPTDNAASHLDAYVWVKPPGESDGGSTDIPNDQGKGFDRMCDPTFNSPKLAGKLTGAKAGAPLAGQWFQEQFEMLVANAYPAIDGDGGTPDPDTQAPTAPTGLTSTAKTSTSVSLGWGAASDDTGVTGYTVRAGGAVVATSATTSVTVTGLSPATAYQFTVTARDAAGNVSPASAPLTVTTSAGSGGGDTQAPSVPTGLAAGTVTTSSVALTWNASTDDVGVTGYRVLRGGQVVATVTGTSATVTGLTADTAYSFQVVAVDAAGNASAASAALSATTAKEPTTPAGACTVTYTANSWNTGFTGSITLKNDSASTVDGWELVFAFADGQAITQGWSAEYAQSGPTVTVTPAAWSSSIPAGGSVSFGFNGSHSGTNTEPTAFTLDGTACTVA